MNRSDRKGTLRKDYYTIGDISKLYHIGTDSLRYYEEKGLISPKRSDTGYRLYRDQDLWRLNVIEELRSLDFPVEKIRSYLEEESLASTLRILEDEQKRVQQKIEQLKSTQSRIEETIRDLKAAQDLVTGQIVRQHFETRHAFVIRQRFSSDEAMDLLMNRLADRQSDGFHIIGNRRLGAQLTPLYDPGSIYSGAILLADDGPETIPEGDYLTISYRGKWNSRLYARKLIDYATEQKIRLDPQFIDLVIVDIHAASRVEDQVSEVQVRIKNGK